MSTYYFPLKPVTYHDITIDWGDGTSETYIGTPPYGANGNVNSPHAYHISHEYLVDGVYEIKVKENSKNGYPGFYQYGYSSTGYLTSAKSLLSFNSYGQNRYLSLNYLFSGCTRLSSFPAIPYDKIVDVTSMAGTFFNCISLRSFEAFDTKNITNMIGAWGNCFLLSSFPWIDTSNVVYLGSSSGLPWGTGGVGAWQNCRALSSFPLIDTSKVVRFCNAWENCHSLKSFPPIDTSSVGTGRDFFSVWYGCSGLTSFPWIDTSNVGAFGNGNQGTLGTWTYCSSLTSFPAIDTSRAAAFFQT